MFRVREGLYVSREKSGRRDGPAGVGPWALFALAVACAGAEPARLTLVRTGPGALPEVPPEWTPPSPGVDPGVRARACAVELTVDPRQETYHGLLEVDLLLLQPARQLWLRGAAGLVVQGASVSTRGATRPAHAVRLGEEGLGLVLKRPAGVGPAKLRVAWEGRAQAPGGLLRREEGGHWYAHTRLQPGEAWRLVPTLGESTLPLPWSLTLRIPAEDSASSSLDVASETVGPDGLRTVRFAPQDEPGAPLAFTVGPPRPGPARTRGGRHAPRA
ncbi:hypothetical protein P2318_27730 [Myxococcaceae bacterium GXIMD 01537]